MNQLFVFIICGQFHLRKNLAQEAIKLDEPNVF